MGNRWQRLPPGQQPLLVLAHLRKGGTCTALASGFGASVSARPLTGTVMRLQRGRRVLLPVIVLVLCSVDYDEDVFFQMRLWPTALISLALSPSAVLTVLFALQRRDRKLYGIPNQC